MINNPVLRRELMRGRLRQPRPTLIGVGLVIVLILMWIYYEVITDLISDGAASAGRDAWRIVIWIQFALMCLIAPSITANSIAQEKEQQTWEMLLFTRLMPGEIILGKLVARLAFLSVVIMLGLPIALFAAVHADRDGSSSAAFVSTGQFLGAYATIGVCGLFFATFGLFMSWLLNRTLYAIMSSYSFVVGGLIIVTFIVAALLSSLMNDASFLTHCPLMWFNPILIIIEVTVPDQHVDTIFLIYGLIGYTLLSALMIWRMIAGFRRFAYEP